MLVVFLGLGDPYRQTLELILRIDRDAKVLSSQDESFAFRHIAGWGAEPTYLIIDQSSIDSGPVIDQVRDNTSTKYTPILIIGRNTRPDDKLVAAIEEPLSEGPLRQKLSNISLTSMNLRERQQS